MLPLLIYRFETEILNKSQHKSPWISIDLKSPQEVWSDQPFEYSSLRIFVCPTYVHVNDGKLEARIMKCIFQGYAPRVKSYQLWYTREGKNSKNLVSRDVTYNKASMWLRIRWYKSCRERKTSDQKMEFVTQIPNIYSCDKWRRACWWWTN